MQNPKINQMLHEKNICNVVTKDIQYQEGVTEILENKQEIHMLFLTDLLPGKMSCFQFIEMLCKIKPELEIILILEQENTLLKEKLNEIGIYQIYEKCNINIDMIEKLIQRKQEEDILKELQRLKELLNQRNKGFSMNNSKKKEGKKKKIDFFQKTVISICGEYASGKTVMAMMMGYVGGCNNKIKTLVIDFDIFHQAITSMKETNKKIQDSKLIESFIFPVEKNFDVLCGIQQLFTAQDKLTQEKLEYLVQELQKKYQLIIFDTSPETNFEYVKLLLDQSDKILFLIEPNFMQLKLSDKLLKTYVEKWAVDKNKIKILINKNMSNSVSVDIIKKLFQEYAILEVIPFQKRYTTLMNHQFGLWPYQKSFYQKQDEILKKLCH